ncbi:MAG TPA: hypothetical protein DCK85_13340, partial [Ktedonobacter sp.]|nr:hypothetical protein [Ktedonobacter sp.]
MIRPVFLALGLVALLATMLSIPLHAAGSHVLRVGSYHGIAGQFQSIQAAVNAAQPGDWILVGPGDYHEQGASNDGVPVSYTHLRAHE